MCVVWLQNSTEFNSTRQKWNRLYNRPNNVEATNSYKSCVSVLYLDKNSKNCASVITLWINLITVFVEQYFVPAFMLQTRRRELRIKSLKLVKINFCFVLNKLALKNFFGLKQRKIKFRLRASFPGKITSVLAITSWLVVIASPEMQATKCKQLPSASKDFLKTTFCSYPHFSKHFWIN